LDAASEGFARALGFHVTRGRWLTDSEPEPVLVITESLARQEFGDEDPLGHRLQLPGPRDQAPTYAPIIGVVRDLRHSRLDAEPIPAAYLPYRHYRSLVSFRTLVKTPLNPWELATQIRAIVSQIGPSQAVYDMRTIEEALAESIAPRTLNLALFSAFAAVALLLSLLGVYGVLSYSVVQRTPEIGVRMALGAGKPRIAALVIQQGLSLAFAGVIVGVGTALFLSRLIAGLLYDVEATDPPTFVAVAVFLMTTSVLASYLPARRAARVDPMVALRCE
jgi:putative ABC transport system permease protein